jgi:ABC-type multidrug transport system ATPase subunit
MRLNSVAFRYRRRSPWVLRDVSQSLPPGRIIEVTGHNGAGKSTLLRLLAGVLRPVRGDVEARPARVGYAPERFPAEQPFTARGYLSHMARTRGTPVTSIATWADRLRFAGSLDEPLTRLSKGNAHKVGLAQAVLGDPGLLVLDEPFAGLDAETRAELPAMLTGPERAEPVTGFGTEPMAEHIPERVRTAVIEVVVPLHEATAVLARLRDDGYDAREPRPC